MKKKQKEPINWGKIVKNLTKLIELIGVSIETFKDYF